MHHIYMNDFKRVARFPNLTQLPLITSTLLSHNAPGCLLAATSEDPSAGPAAAERAARVAAKRAERQQLQAALMRVRGLGITVCAAVE